MADRGRLALGSIVVAALCASAPAFGNELGLAPAVLGDGADLYLEVFINGRSAELVAEFHQASDGALTIAPDELREAGLLPVEAAENKAGMIVLARLPGVSFTYDAVNQQIHFEAPDKARAARVVQARPEMVPQTETHRDPGALINYTVFGGGGRDKRWRFDGVSTLVEARGFGSFGTISATGIGRVGAHDGARVQRLDTSWSYADPSGPITYKAGDTISGGLSWSRPVRLGGIQVRRSFETRPDLVTTPLADLRGAADVPSTVEVYIDQTKRLSTSVPAGPFAITNLPLVTGASTARLVVRDALGREQVSEQAFFASSDMLAAGLFDFSAEIGFARRDYGGWDDSYDSRLVASASARFGLSDDLTLEAHVEGGGGLINGGGGAIATLGEHAVGGLSAAASRYDGLTGYQFAASLEMEWSDVRIFARSQRSYGAYADIASITAFSDPVLREDISGAMPPRALDQLALSLPSPSEDGALNVSFTRLLDASGEDSRLIGASFSQPVLGDAMLFATAFQDLGSSNFGVFAGLSVPLGDDTSATTSISSQSHATTIAADIIKSERAEVGGFGWRLRASAGDETSQSGAISYRTALARLEATATHGRDNTHVTGQVEGALVFAGGDVFAANRIDDAFAIVDAGAPDVDVRLENRAAGRTNRSGRLLVPGLSAWQVNHLSIDPANLPLDAVVDTTARTVTPADRSGAVVHFDVDSTAKAAIVTLRDPAGGFVAAGSTGRLESAGEDFVVGYDGEAYIGHLSAHNTATITSPSGTVCVARFAFTSHAGEQGRVEDARCVPSDGAPS